MPRPDFDKHEEDTKFSVQQEAQASKMGNGPQPHNPNKAPRTNEPNAGGKNRESGHRG